MINALRNVLPVMLAVASAAASAAPMGYSVDSDAPDGDTLHYIDMATGEATPLGKVQSVTGVRKDVEGLAFSPSGTLWAVDEGGTGQFEASRRLFPISMKSGLVGFGLNEEEKDIGISGLDELKGNDFGMTFTCTGELFLTSVASQSLYTLDPTTGAAKLVGTKGSLGYNISALAAWGNPVELYGLGNGMDEQSGAEDSRSLFKVDPVNGTASLIGDIGDEAGAYTEAGLSFDEDRNLWALTDRSNLGSLEYFSSEVLRIDIETGKATRVGTTKLAGSNTGLTGFESLAVARPAGCDAGLSEYSAIPTLGRPGLLLMLLALLAPGLLTLHRRTA
jgi:hypothetical protein